MRNFDRFCRQNLQTMSAELFQLLGTNPPDPIPGLFAWTLLTRALLLDPTGSPGPLGYIPQIKIIGAATDLLI